MILLTVSTVCDAADETQKDEALWPLGPELVFAARAGLVNLPNRSSANTYFNWTPKKQERDWKYIVIHHSATGSGSVESIHNQHRQRRDASGVSWLGIGYHFVIGNGSGMDDGEVEATFRWRQQIHGAHSGSATHNATGIGICLIGDFQKHQPSTQQINALTSLVSQLARRYSLSASSIIGHNKVKPTFCPGRNFPLEQVISRALGRQAAGT
ncbi:MAG: peptidoglycan recognition family protein [Fuerstiella sp.]